MVPTTETFVKIGLGSPGGSATVLGRSPRLLSATVSAPLRAWLPGALELELWSCNSGAAALELELWIWSSRSGAGALNLELWSWSSGSGAGDLELGLWIWSSGFGVDLGSAALAVGH